MEEIIEKEKESCELWGHFPAPLFIEDGTIIALHCKRCRRPMREES